MVLFVFVVDTSASMNLPLSFTKTGLSKLDVAKTGIETFFKVLKGYLCPVLLVSFPCLVNEIYEFTESQTLLLAVYKLF